MAVLLDPLSRFGRDRSLAPTPKMLQDTDREIEELKEDKECMYLTALGCCTCA